MTGDSANSHATGTKRRCHKRATEGRKAHKQDTGQNLAKAATAPALGDRDDVNRLCCANLLRAGVSLPLDRPILRVS